MANAVLVPIDFGQQSLIALEHAKYFATKFDATVHLLTVVEESGFLQKLISDDYQERLINEAQKALKAVADEHLKDLAYQLHVAVGKAYEQIEQMADKLQPLAIFMGKTENPTLAKRILGSNTLHVIQETNFPVISIRGKKLPQHLNNIILLPLDVTKPFTEQLNAAIEFADKLKAKIFILTISQEQDVTFKTQVLVKLNKAKETVEKAGIECQTKALKAPRSEIVPIINQHAQELNPILTVIMTHSENLFEELFLGSIAKGVLETLLTPVLSIKPWNIEQEQNPVIKILYDPMGIW